MNCPQILRFCGELPPRFESAMEQLGPLLGFTAGDGPTRVEGFSAQGLSLEKHGELVRIGWQKPVQFYRALSLLCGVWDNKDYHRTEHPCFETGMMFDVSRNAVLRLDTLRSFLRRMALMGINVGMMYTEDTYEVPNEPYFGYMRGRYSTEDLRQLDDYADMLGVELVPCIQTLGHLNRVLHWPTMARYADNGEVLLADSEDTYALLARMLKAASAPYRTRRIHIGMDEAHGIGLGAHLRRHGFEDPHTIIRRHLLRVKGLCDELGLQPMMWSDMYFRPDSPTHGYYDGEVSPAAVASVVPGVQLVYWDYCHDSEDEYEAMFKKHALLTDVPLFAGGIWTWTGPAPDYEKTLATAIPALTACKKAGVPFVLAAAWGDNGAEANLLTALPGMQLYAEFAYTGGYAPDWLAQRFAVCCQAPVSPLLGLSRFNTVPGMKATDLRPVNAAKFLLYQDPMVQLFAKDTEGLAMADHYQALAREYAGYAAQGGLYGQLMDFYARLARVLASKCRWHEGIAQAVVQDDKPRARQLAGVLQETAEEAEGLRLAWGRLWMATNKPYGFEVLDGRMGAVCARLKTASARVLAWADGKTEDSLEELRQTPLPYTLREGGALFGSYAVSEIVSACKIDL